VAGLVKMLYQSTARWVRQGDFQASRRSESKRAEPFRGRLGATESGRLSGDPRLLASRSLIVKIPRLRLATREAAYGAVIIIIIPVKRTLTSKPH
jgi:hypothetical protein